LSEIHIDPTILASTVCAPATGKCVLLRQANLYSTSDKWQNVACNKAHFAFRSFCDAKMYSDVVIKWKPESYIKLI